jgi:DNA-binding NtrC family response regulator
MKTRILVVDDEKEFAETIAERLKLRGNDVTVSFSGDEAIEKVRDYLFDVVILDVAMPGKDGIETLREIKSMKPLTEVIMLTGHGTMQSAIEGMKLGAYDFLLKPCETDELVDKINKAYERKSEQDERIRSAKVNDIISSPRSVLE